MVPGRVPHGRLMLLGLLCAQLQIAAAAPPATLDPAASAGSAGSEDFAQVLAPRSFEFPRDHGAHPEFRQEWWYLTGNLDAANGERFGFELTFFRVALVPPARAAAGAAAAAPGTPPASAASAWRTRTIYVAHFAVTDLARRRFRFQQKIAREALGLAGAEGAPLRVWLDDWSLEIPEEKSGDPWRLHSAQPGYALDLTLVPQSAPVLNGEAGLSRKSSQAGDATYYYSIPRLAVHGRVLRDGEPLELRGLAWLDREWGSGGLGPHEVGWDWFALQLDDGSALMFYALRNEDGGRDRHSAGTWIAPGGAARPLSNADVSIAVTASWRNRANDRYPAAWHIRVPALELDLTVHPALAEQELRTTPPYWEGAVEVRGTRAGQAVGGRGYVELVGYAQER
jgi:predicted secreted hydrolase